MTVASHTAALASFGEVTRLVKQVRTMDAENADDVKSCCATAYGLDLVALFLGESYHPGGLALTRLLATEVGLTPGMRVLDVACGTGTSSLMLAEEYGVDVLGIDLGEAQVAKARARAEARGLVARARFEVGDAEGLPAADGSVDAIVCECAFCTFPTKARAASEIARVLAPGGRAGITDVWIEPDRLDPDLAGLAGRISCIADARPIAEVRSILESAGLRVTTVERHDEALAATISQVEVRLRALKIANLPFLRSFNLARGVELARRAADMVRRGDAGYMLIVAGKAEKSEKG